MNKDERNKDFYSLLSVYKRFRLESTYSSCLGTPSSSNNGQDIVEGEFSFTKFLEDFVIQWVEFSITKTKGLSLVNKCQELFEFSLVDFSRLIFIDQTKNF